MNADKTQLVWLGTCQQLAKLSTNELPLLSALVKPMYTCVSSAYECWRVRHSRWCLALLDLGINIDSQLTMADHVAALCRSCLFQLRQLRTVRSSVTSEAAKTLMHEFVSSHLLDYFNSLLYRISDSLLTNLKTVQNAAASVVTETENVWPHYSSAASTPLASCMAANHLQVGNYHLEMTSRSGAILPGWRVVPISSVVFRWKLQHQTLVMPRTRTTIGRWNFAVSGLVTWNSLPVEL